MNIREIVGKKNIAKGQYWSKSLTLVQGCMPISEGCEHCWSAAMASRFPWGKGFAENGKWTGKIEPNLKSLQWLSSRARHKNALKPQVICIWNDLFHEEVSDQFVDEIMRIMWHLDDIFLILTKRPEHIFDQEWPSFERAAKKSNIWFGVSVENQNHIDRIDTLIKHWPGRKFVSLEPCLGDPGLKPYLSELDWVIVGCESGPGARLAPFDNSIEWLYENIIDPCVEAGVPIFVKQWRDGKKLVKMPSLFGKHWNQMPEVK